MANVSLEVFQTDIRKRCLVERALEIISEASRRLPEDLKARHPSIPWPKVAGIGNVLRHDYEHVTFPSLTSFAIASTDSSIGVAGSFR